MNSNIGSDIVAHPHNTTRTIPERLPSADIRLLSVLQPSRALAAVAQEWAGVAAAIIVCEYAWHPMLYLVAVMFIGARQQALTVLGHDAVHFRFLRNRRTNDLLGNLLAMWPVFSSVEGFRRVHGLHHQYTNLAHDGNRFLWKTHSPQGELLPEWIFPKTRLNLWMQLLRHACVWTGLLWIGRGLAVTFRIPMPRWMVATKLILYMALVAVLTFFNAWHGFLWYWLVPFCTWHILIQYVRLICEHSAVRSDHAEFRVTRTTIPTWFESFFILPRHIGYHIEHHWYPSVPFYRLPELHALLMSRDSFRSHADIKRSVWSSLRECSRSAE